MAIPSIRLLPFLCSLLFLLIIFTYQTNAVYDTQGLFHYFCDHDNNRGNYTTNSTYHTNLNTLLSTLTSNQEVNYGFYNFSYGENTNKVNAIGLCRGDLRPNNCRSCLNGSRANLTRLCPNRKEAIFWYENERCMLCYSDREIFNVMEDVPRFISNNSNDSVDVDLSNQVVRELLEKLTNRAVSMDSRLKYAAASQPGPKYETIYGLVQCTPDLSNSACNNCLAESLEQIPGCCKGGRVVRPSCNMRFATYLFYEPTAAPPPLTPPPPSTTATDNTSSPGKSNNTTIGIAIAVPVIVVLMFTFICICLRVRKPRKRFEKKKNGERHQSKAVGKSSGFKRSLTFCNAIKEKKSTQCHK